MRVCVPFAASSWFVILLGAVQAVRASSEQAAPAAPAAPYVQSDEVKAFRKTAITVSFPSRGLMLHGWVYKPMGEGPFPALVWNHGSEKRPTAHPELGRFYTSHGYVVFLPVRQGHSPSPGEYISDVIDAYRDTVKDEQLVYRKAIEMHNAYNADVVAALEWLRAAAVRRWRRGSPSRGALTAASRP